MNDQIKDMLTRDLIFDGTADAVGLIFPGGSIAVKLVKAVVDRKKINGGMADCPVKCQGYADY